MDWVSIIAAALSGALAGVVASVAVRGRSMGRTAQAVIFTAAFLVFNTLAREFVVPSYRAYELERSLLNLPAYREIAIADPDAYSRITTTLRGAIADRAGLQQAIAQSRSIVGEVAVRHLPRASNEAVTAYVSVMLEELDQLARADHELCYAFLFPQANAGRMFGQHIDEATQRRDLEELAHVIGSARASPQLPPTSDQAEPLLERVVARLSEDFGSDVQLLHQAPHARSDWPKVCDVTRALYRQIASLPQEQSGVALRYLLGPQ